MANSFIAYRVRACPQKTKSADLGERVISMPTLIWTGSCLLSSPDN
ncbi:hypothetical protein YE105_C3819 [Yersinia enterocolitica subsp. palearctica 105.5R(r)]|uniref:Uncharacterized protein n=1 Tax=Yersinia enterocolitica subsp. palearctica serotype O:3 (strain DSM 13030 / CIP 106945 / Y11) TaxID=930944 RepID=A0A0H3NWJ8_YERE1|nr:hypothetical protein YE105_C3819 [Yersinia enterocolitica subsp. palearctica 105.5R(r)]CBY29437.1 hypothetical protein Y11_30931 [Yersinia enterocolitica subsp. palearctica Y11]CCO68063.1 hypothetical protein D322_1183 [Yersinia enterocolitica IP 10393]